MCAKKMKTGAFSSLVIHGVCILPFARDPDAKLAKDTVNVASSDNVLANAECELQEILAAASMSCEYSNKGLVGG